MICWIQKAILDHFECAVSSGGDSQPCSISMSTREFAKLENLSTYLPTFVADDRFPLNSEEDLHNIWEE